MCAVGNDYGIDHGLMAVFLVEFLLGGGDEIVVKIVFNQVDGATAETAAHDSGARYTAFFGDVVEVIKFYAGYLIVLGEALMGFVHFFTDGFAVAALEGVANVEHALFLFNYEFGA